MTRLLTGLLLPLLFTHSATAQFVRTGDGVFQHTDELAKVIISSDDREPGVFVLVMPSDHKIRFQSFDPEKISAIQSANADTSPAVLHAFFRYDKALKRFTAVLIGATTYQIKGSLTLHMGGFRITIDNEEKAYLSLVYSDDVGETVEPDILGILNLAAIVNYSGNVAVALLEAHQFTRFSGLIAPYVIEGDVLKLEGKPVTTSIGLALERDQNICQRSTRSFRKRPIYLYQEDLSAIQKLSSQRSRIAALSRLIEDAEEIPPFKIENVLVLRADKKHFIGYYEGEIFTVKPLKRTADWLTCVIEPVTFEE